MFTSLTGNRNPSLSDAGKLTKKCLMGGLGVAGVIRTGTANQVFNMCRKTIKDVGKTGFILAVGCGLPIDVPEENLLAVRRAVEG